MAAVRPHAAGRAQPHAPVPRQVGAAARAGLRGAALLPGADGRRRARLPRPRGAGRRGPARAHRADARRRRALQRPLRRDARGARERGSPRSARGSWTCRSPTRKMSTTGGTEQGTVYVLDEPDVVRKKFKRAVTDSGREIVRSPDKPGVTNLIDILAVVRDVDAEAIERDFDGPRLRRPQDRGRRRGGRLARARCASATPSCGADEAAAGGDPRRRRRQGPRDRRR